MKFVALGDVADFIRGVTFKPDDVLPLGTDASVACLRTKNVQESLDLSDVWAIPSSLVKSPEKIVREGDIVVSTANSWNLVGKCSWIPRLEWKTTAGGFVSLLRARPDKLDPRFLYHWLIRDETQACFRGCARQTTNISNLSIKQAEALTLPLPSLGEQKRIAAILDQTDSLRRLRQRAVDRLNSLVQAMFYEMFGDSAEGRYPIVSLESVSARIDYGLTASATDREIGPKFLRITDIQDGKVNWETVPYCDATQKQKTENRLFPGDIVFARTGATTGKSFLIQECPDDTVFASYLIRVRPSEKLLPEFLAAFFQTQDYWRQISLQASGAAQPGVNSTRLKQLALPMPPLDEQRRFRRSHAEIADQMRLLETDLTKRKVLFSSLQHRAFRGEL